MFINELSLQLLLLIFKHFLFKYILRCNLIEHHNVFYATISVVLSASYAEDARWLEFSQIEGFFFNEYSFIHLFIDLFIYSFIVRPSVRSFVRLFISLLGTSTTVE